MALEDAGHGLFRDRREGYDLGKTAQEFRTEIILHDVHQIVVLRDLALVERIDDELATNVGGKQNQCVGEVGTFVFGTTIQSIFGFSFTLLRSAIKAFAVRYLLSGFFCVHFLITFSRLVGISG